MVIVDIIVNLIGTYYENIKYLRNTRMYFYC